MRRRHFLHAPLLAGLGTHLVPARACEYFTHTLRIVHPWTRATAADASEAALCMTLADVVVPDRLLRVETPVAEGFDLGAGIAVTPGDELVMSERGTHVRLTGLRQGLEVGRSYPLTLTFEKGGPVQATLNVDFARFR